MHILSCYTQQKVSSDPFSRFTHRNYTLLSGTADRLVVELVIAELCLNHPFFLNFGYQSLLLQFLSLISSNSLLSVSHFFVFFEHDYT